MNENGQAAVTDALYFLMIVTFLSVFLFGFANSYGNSVKEQIGDEFNTTFATNALKTILYSSTPRDFQKSIYDEDAEIDSLLAIIKEDYSDDQKIDNIEKVVLGKTISSILSPIEDSIDYVFYITVPPQQLVFFYFHTTNFEQINFKEGELPIPGRFVIFTPGEPPHINYFCGIPTLLNGGNVNTEDVFAVDYTEFVERRLARLLANVGPTSQASAQIKLVKVNSRNDFSDFFAQADLIMWDASWLGETNDRSAIFDEFSWECKTIEEIEGKIGQN